MCIGWVQAQPAAPRIVRQSLANAYRVTVAFGDRAAAGLPAEVTVVFGGATFFCIAIEISVQMCYNILYMTFVDICPRGGLSDGKI